MKTVLNVPRKDPVMLLDSNIVYSGRRQWCDTVTQPLAISMIRPRVSFSYDEPHVFPVIIWLTGGGFIGMDRNAYMAELAWYAKQGFVIASVDYSTTPYTVFPQQVEDIKLAIRTLRAKAAEYCIDPDRVVVMGESAGGYLAAFTALSGDDEKYKTGGYERVSDAVNAAVSLYPCVENSILNIDPKICLLSREFYSYPGLLRMVKPDSPPIMVVHGSTDEIVPVSQGEMLYDKQAEQGIDTQMIILKDANHADAQFFQPQVKQLMIDFIRSKLV